MARIVAMIGAVAFLLAGCGSGGDLMPSPVFTEEDVSGVSREVLASDLNVPWDVAQLPDSSYLVTLRDRAELKRVVPGQAPQLIAGLSEVVSGGDGGLLGLALSPSFANDHLLYAFYTTTDDNRVVRFQYSDSGLSNPTPLLTGIPKGSVNDGGRIAFGPDGNLYIGTGDTGRPGLADDTNSLAGKILRVAANGSIPADNPFGNAVYSYGFRDVEGLAWDGGGRLFATDRGQQVDELNLIEKGRNYGWPRGEGRSSVSGLINPLLTWSTDRVSVSGLSCDDETLYIAGLRSGQILRTEWRDGELTDPETVVSGLGSVRTVVADSDSVYALTNNTDGDSAADGDDRLLSVQIG